VNNKRERLILFTRYPEPGKTKTRLIPALGEEGAAKLQRQMTEHILAQAVKLLEDRPVTIEICFEGGDKKLMEGWLGAGLAYRRQGNGDIGRRMGRAFEEAFSSGAESVVLFGSDIPGLTSEILENAFSSISEKGGGNDVVFGPAADGGYYLIGLIGFSGALSKPAFEKLFSDIEWGTNSVLKKSLAIAEENGLSFTLLETLKDVDRPEDIPTWDEVSRLTSTESGQKNISVIIPTLNEEANIKRAMETVFRAENRKNVEIIVVDGSSTDDTTSIAKSLGAVVISTSPSRALQMNRGAEVAKGKYLLFLHADTTLPRGFDRHIVKTLSTDGVAAGAFELKIDSPVLPARIVEYGSNFRSRHFKLPYGDQAIFLSAESFHEVGGYKEISIMEDFELIKRLQKRGDIVTVPVPILTSSRRWEKFGAFKTTVINQVVILAYKFGISTERIRRWYHRGDDESK
jgi:uncharacterized protein